MSIDWKEAVRFFLNEYAMRQRGLSPKTRHDYATSLQLFARYLKQNRRAEMPMPCGVEVKTVLDFLQWLEESRGNSVSTRNARLGALKSFWKALKIVDPDCIDQYDRLLTSPFKRCRRRTPDYLEMNEPRTIFECIDPATSSGFLPLVILRFLYNTGARLSEVAHANLSHLFLDDRREVILQGKAGGIRVVPLLETTCELLKGYIRRERIGPRPGYEDFLFTNQRRRSFTRCGLCKILRSRIDRAAEVYPNLKRKRITPPSIRHTTAVPLLRAGVDINVIKAWLGHKRVETTSGYLDLDVDKKREALEKFRSLDSLNRAPAAFVVEAEREHGVLKWLDSL